MKGMMIVQFLRDSLSVYLFFLFLMSMTAVRGQKKVLAKKEQEIFDMRVTILTTQISQHFIYNTLTTIKYLCKKDAGLAAETVDEFSGYLRGNFDSLTGDKTICFSKELDHVKYFLSIEQKRFGKRINVIYDIREEDFMLPVLTLQPIVENAVRHGVVKREQGGTICISTGKSGEDYWIRVEDDGVGYRAKAKEKDKETHIGLENVTSRVKSLCGGTVTVESSLEEGTKVLIQIPERKKRIRHRSTQRDRMNKA